MKIEMNMPIPSGWRLLGVKKCKDVELEDVVLRPDGPCRGRHLNREGDWPYVVLEHIMPDVGEWVRVPDGQIKKVVRHTETDILLLGVRMILVEVEGDSKQYNPESLEVMDRVSEAPDFCDFCQLVGEFGSTLIDEGGLVYNIESVEHHAVIVSHPRMGRPKRLSFEEIKDWYIGRHLRARTVGKDRFIARFGI